MKKLINFAGLAMSSKQIAEQDLLEYLRLNHKKNEVWTQFSQKVLILEVKYK